MRSSSGEHYLALDHVRAVAAFMVFAWHFTHGSTGFPVPFEYLPAVIPLALLDEGHCGVALFMTLSGYLFAKLLDGRQVRFPAFLWNRLLRLAPLLVVVIVANGFRQGVDWPDYLWQMATGLRWPVWPNGGWSVTVELHFYVLLPLLLWLLRRNPAWLVVVLVAAILLRVALHAERGEIQTLAYPTLIGRIDQFLLGMLAFHHRAMFARRHLSAAAIATAFALAYWLFDARGGYYRNPSFPSPDRLWVVLATVEGAAFGALIAWYDGSFAHRRTPLARFVARLGEYSYSMYLLHFFFVFAMSRFVHTHLMRLDNFYVACAWAVAGFLLAMPLAWASYRFVESPFLRLRRAYTRPLALAGARAAGTTARAAG